MAATTFNNFVKVIQEEVDRFQTVSPLSKVQAKTLTIEDYHRFLKMIFHQTFNAAASFALAGGNCDPSKHEIRDYLIKHADEERTHWQWVLGDLEKTGYNGPDLRLALPSPRVSAFVGFNFYVASRYPPARLANAAVLEGIGATYAKKFAKSISEQLDLTKDQLVFTLGHSDTDVGHTQEIFDLLERSNLRPDEWSWMIHSAKTSAMLYREMYNEEWGKP